MLTTLNSWINRKLHFFNKKHQPTIDWYHFFCFWVVIFCLDVPPCDSFLRSHFFKNIFTPPPYRVHPPRCLWVRTTWAAIGSLTVFIANSVSWTKKKVFRADSSPILRSKGRLNKKNTNFFGDHNGDFGRWMDEWRVMDSGQWLLSPKVLEVYWKSGIFLKLVNLVYAFGWFLFDFVCLLAWFSTIDASRWDFWTINRSSFKKWQLWKTKPETWGTFMRT